AMYVPSRNTATITHMGGEGANWIGQAPFTTEQHVFQNLGDGTYFAQRPLGDPGGRRGRRQHHLQDPLQRAVAMTGGQPVEGQLTVPQITRQVEAEAAKRIVVVPDEPHKYPRD